MVVNTAFIFAPWTQAWYWNDIKVPTALYIDVGIKNAFSVSEREVSPLKKNKSQYRAYQNFIILLPLGHSIKYSELELVFIRNPFPFCTGDRRPATGPEFLQSFKKEKSRHGIAITCKDMLGFQPQARGTDAGWQGQRLAWEHRRPHHLLQSCSLLQDGGPQGMWPSGSVWRGNLQRATWWFMLYGTKTTGMFFVCII